MKESDRQDILSTVGNALGYALIIAAQNPPSTPDAAKKLQTHIMKAAMDSNTSPEVATVLIGIADAISLST